MLSWGKMKPLSSELAPVTLPCRSRSQNVYCSPNYLSLTLSAPSVNFWLTGGGGGGGWSQRQLFLRVRRFDCYMYAFSDFSSTFSLTKYRNISLNISYTVWKRTNDNRTCNILYKTQQQRLTLSFDTYWWIFFLFLGAWHWRWSS